MNKVDKNLKISLLGTLYTFLFASMQVQAQVIEDNTLSTEVETENNRDFTVTEGEQRGSNLFHSFDEFSIPRNGSVLFDNAISIQNIITRVTGSSISNINGLIENNGTANLFLINPNGIIFGENATLNIGGSFIGTTAESLFFEDGTEFSTEIDNSQSPLLTVSVPLGLQFGSNSGEITNQANFSIPDSTGQDQTKLGLTTSPAKTFALFGNGITFDGGAATSEMGNIQLGSVSDNSFVALESIDTGWKANYDNVSQFQDLEFDNLASVDTSGEGGGDINITGKNIEIFNGSAITSNTLGNVDGGIIEVQASNLLEINGSDITGTKLDSFLTSVEIFLPFASQISSNTFGAGRGGDIKITTQNLKVIDGGAIELQTFSENINEGGNLFIKATGLIELSGVRPLLGVGQNADNLILPSIPLDTAIEINQSSEISTVSVNDGNAGSVNIESQNISLQDGAIIQSSPFGSGEGGDINIIAANSIDVVGTSPREGILGSTIGANAFAEGDSGNINIDSNRLTLQDGGRILSVTNSLGDAGTININTSETEITGVSKQKQIPSLISAEATGGGDGGNISLNTDSLQISDRASLSVQGSGESVPGNLAVNANSIELSNFGSITAETEFEAGGNIQLNVQDRLILRDNSLISAEASNDANGGNLDIDARFIVAFPQENNDILANAVFGNGGNITINTEGIFGLEERNSNPPNQTNDIDASSEFGTAGTVSILFPRISKTEGTFQTSSNMVDAAYLFKNTFCKIRGNNRFIATGRNGLPLFPDDAILPAYGWSDWRMVEAEDVAAAEVKEVEAARPRKIVMIQGWITDTEGNVVLTDKPVAVASRKPGLNSPDCNQLK